ncbi:MAG: ABC transporter substrate-binding protein [Dehalococcoidia bacterium]|nr:ABC transporter substrate-binding protein [Dehalococcoidia bacterium]
MVRRFGWSTPLVALLALVALVGVACGGDEDGSTGGSADNDGRALVVALTSEPSNLSPVFLDVNAGNWKIFSGLVAFDQDLQLVPDLAAEMPEYSEDGRTVTVRLRQDVTFHDGEPLTSEDVVFTWNAILDTDVATPIRERLALDGLIEGVRAVDEFTVEFTLSRMDPAFMERLYTGIVPAHLLEGEDLNSTSFNREPVGTGPYRFASWVAGDRLVFEAYEDYYGGAPAIKRVVFTFVPDENARAALMGNGEIDFTRMSPRLAENFEANEDVRVVQVPSASMYQLTLPNKHPAISDVRVRQALSMAVNREEMAATLIGPLGQPAYGPFREGHWAYDDSGHVDYDPQGARDLLAEAGWTESDSQGFLLKDGERLTFTILYLASNAEDQEFALALASDFQEIGVDARVEVGSNPGYQDRLDADAFFHGVGMPYDPEYVMRARFHSDYADVAANPAGMANPDVDAALDASRATLDPEERREAFIDLQRALLEDGSYLIIAERPTVVLVSADIEGLVPQMAGSPHAFVRGLSWNLEDWSWK